MDAGGRATQDAKAEDNYTTKALPSLNAKHAAAKSYSKEQHAQISYIKGSFKNFLLTLLITSVILCVLRL